MKRCSPPSFPDNLVTGTQVEMIGIGQKNLNSQLFQLRLRHPLDCACRPYRHEDRRLHDPVWRVEKACPRSRCPILRNNLKSQCHDGRVIGKAV